MIVGDLDLWSWLYPVALPSPAVLPASYSARSAVPPPAAGNMGLACRVDGIMRLRNGSLNLHTGAVHVYNGTVHLCHAGPDADVFGLGLPLYIYKHEMESASGDKAKASAVLAPLPEVARLIWHRYGINLAALASLEAVGGEFMASDSGPIKAFAYLRVTEDKIPDLRQGPEIIAPYFVLRVI